MENQINLNRRQMFVKIIVLCILTCFLLSSCTSRSRRTSRWGNNPSSSSSTTTKTPEKKEVKPPNVIKIILYVKSWEIKDHRLLNWSPEYGNLMMAGRFIMNDELVFKLISQKFDDYFWLAKIPTVKKGQYTVKAKRYLDSYSQETKLPEPPREIQLFVKVRDKMIRHHFLIDHDTRSGKFVFDRAQKGLLYLKNDWYPGAQWAARLPKSDGDWTLHLQLMSAKR